MTRIVLDAATIERLAAVQETAEILDNSGTVLGHYEPVTANPGKLPPGTAVPFSAAEIEQARGTRSGRTTQEILADLGLQ